MKNFCRALRESLNFLPTIVAATLCSIGIAVLWGSNIGALYPVIEMTLHGESIQRWLEKSVEHHDEQVQEVDNKLAAINDDGSLLHPADSPLRKSLDRQRKQSQAASELRSWALSWAKRIFPTDPFQTICFIMGILVVSTLVKHLLMLASDMLLGYASSSMVRNLRQRLFHKALELDRLSYHKHGASTLLASVTSKTDRLSAGLMAVFGLAIREPLRVLACLVFASFISFRLLLLSAVLAPLLIVVVVIVSRSLRKVASSMLGKNVRFHEILLESLNNVSTIQNYTMESKEEKVFSSCTKDMQRLGLKMILVSGLGKPVAELIGVGMVAIAVCGGAYLVVNQQTHILGLQIRDTPLTITDLLMFFGFLIGASDPLRKLSGLSIVFYTAVMSANMIYGILDSKSLIESPENPKSLDSSQNDLSIEGLSFSFHEEFPVLNDVNLSVPFGKTIVILGPNGSGKSTLVQFIGRFYEPHAGRVRLGGVDIRELDLQDLRRRVAYVSQSTELFNQSVSENIRYGSPDASRSEIEKAAILAHAHEFITDSLSDGYDTVVGQSGQKLSGGQRQRIALARAILRKPEILILDESTSQIDMASEIQIRETLEKMKGQLTIIIITHREALLKVADEIYTMDRGVLTQSHLEHAEKDSVAA
ncbi:ABC transporter ATP-binding protein [Pirellulaceae bacterium SH449]